jgi:hypothetical protein
MSLRKRLLFAILFTIVGLSEPRRVNLHKAEFDVPKPNTWLRGPMVASRGLGDPNWESHPVHPALFSNYSSRYSHGRAPGSPA